MESTLGKHELHTISDGRPPAEVDGASGNDFQVVVANNESGKRHEYGFCRVPLGSNDGPLEPA